MDPIRDALERRTTEGKLLRSALDSVVLAEGQRGQVISILDKDSIEVGIAVRTQSGLVFKAHAKTGLTKETLKDFRLATQVSW
jgi:hypothetical protein